MDTTDAHLEEGAVDWTTSTGYVVTSLPCSGFVDFLYSNRLLKDPASANFSLRTTSSNVANGAAAGCKGCALIHDAVTTFRQDRLPLDDREILFTSRNYAMDSSCLKIAFFLDPVRKRVKEKGAGTREEPVTATDAAEEHVHLYLEYGVLVRLDWSSDALSLNEGLSTKPLAASRPHSHLPDCTSSSETSRRLNQWLVACAETHLACQSFSETALPKRVLEIENSRIYLREETRKKGKYACLSHCWGPQGPSLRLERSTHQRLASGVPVYQLPQTFRDAVSICMSIGVQFLWIDALCIKQDDADDWAQAVATMGDIYETSWITIAATGSSSSQEGIYSTVPRRFKARALRDHEFHVREDLPGFASPVDSIRECDSWPLLRRAWVYQERQLSPRMIHFSQHQIFWACNSSFQSQDGWYPSRWNPSRKNSLEEWKSIVTEYSGLKLTYESDRLPAIAAIVLRVMQNRPGDTYIAGMWRDTLIPDLFWYVVDLQTRPRSTYGIPTWSWASASGGIHHFIRDQPFQQVAQLLDVIFTSIGMPHMGKVKDASITLQGPACCLPKSAYPILGENAAAKLWEDIDVPLLSDIRCIVFKDFDWQAVKPPVGSDHDLTVLFLCEELGEAARVGQHFGGMVLKAVENDAFERVGFVLIYPDSIHYEDSSSEESSDEESSEKGAEAAKDDEDGEDDERINVKNTAHKGAVYFSATIPHIGAERVEADHVDSEDESSGSDSDDVVSSFVHALPVQTFRVI